MLHEPMNFTKKKKTPGLQDWPPRFRVPDQGKKLQAFKAHMDVF